MAIKPALAIWADVEDLGKLESVLIVHRQSGVDENQKTSLNRSLLNINVEILVVVLNGLETKRFNLFINFLESLENAPIISHGADICVEIDEVNPILHECTIVSSKKLFSKIY